METVCTLAFEAHLKLKQDETHLIFVLRILWFIACTPIYDRFNRDGAMWASSMKGHPFRSSPMPQVTHSPGHPCL